MSFHFRIGIASCDGKSNPIRCYSTAELIRATNNFDPSCIIDDLHFDMYRGILDNRTVIIKKYRHRDRNELLPWKTRLRIAKQLASALTYLHTAFPRPIVHRSITSHCILLDDDYVPKLFDYSISRTIPPDQLYVQENFSSGTVGYIDPASRIHHKSSEKTDVYSFGVLLLVFLTRRDAHKRGAEIEFLTADPKLNVSNGQIQIATIADPKILEEVGGDEQAQQQLQDFLALALLCIQDQSEARPDMIDVAKELVRIEKSILP
ncbi:non-functional pseudokinase ZED1-like [Prunus avium]|uniref:Non-functional pseudokinase ZED1-like n=1 Tax=Prunus avium TaxID=42229 RepID=A0A6P5TJY1_PRUAV|nr:non-functional pseudokinase ZED1-like [Prunus avium]